MERNFSVYKTYLDGRGQCYPSMGEMINFYKGLIDIWDESFPDDLSSLFSIERFSRGSSLLDRKRIEEMDFTNTIDTAGKVLRLIEKYKREESGFFVGSSVKEIEEFIKVGLSSGERFRNAILKWTLKPSFSYTIGKISVDTASWKKGRCPLCDSPPGMAVIVDAIKGEKSEQRYLSCCFCSYRWLFDRVACPACANNRPERFGFFAGGSGCEQGAKAISCEECKTYIKTIFIRYRDDGKVAADLEMDIEDVVTIPLDIIANQRGYKALCLCKR